MKTKLLTLVFLSCLLICPALSKAKVLATLNGQEITEEEVDKVATPRMTKILSQMFDIKREVIDQMIEERLLTADAQKQGLTIDSLRSKILSDAKAVTEDEARSIYQLQKERYQGKEFDEIKLQLMAQLSEQKKQMAMGDYIDNLKKQAQIKINLERPRAKVSVDDDPSQGGPTTAPVTLIEFTEYQCPFCKRARATIKQILDTYGDKVHYVIRDFPLSFHNQAKDAANAAQCAGDQGKYWEFSDELWKIQGQQTTEALTKIATDIGLNLEKFNSCVSSQKYYAEIDKDQDDGVVAGVTGTPAYFINGLFLSGAQPFNNFKSLIDEELAK
ncbi:MAG: thioredoxin domain-containing protein [Deltaproteobacteria bacterium]|nr:thioredoxin domain-containing protein [Deltaproteobacteria bacterium]